MFYFGSIDSLHFLFACAFIFHCKLIWSLYSIVDTPVPLNTLALLQPPSPSPPLYGGKSRRGGVTLNCRSSCHRKGFPLVSNTGGELHGEHILSSNMGKHGKERAWSSSPFWRTNGSAKDGLHHVVYDLPGSRPGLSSYTSLNPRGYLDLPTPCTSATREVPN